MNTKYSHQGNVSVVHISVVSLDKSGRQKSRVLYWENFSNLRMSQHMVQEIITLPIESLSFDYRTYCSYGCSSEYTLGNIPVIKN